MMSKNILIWSVCIVLSGLAAVPVARAEQPIIIPVVLVVSQGTGQVSSMGRPEVQTALYRMQNVGSQSPETASNVPEDAGNARVVKNGARPDNLGAYRVELYTVKHVRLNASCTAEISLPVVLKLVINGDVTTDVSIGRSPDVPREHGTKSGGPVIPAVDLLTGRPTTVRPEYIAEYRRIVGSGRK